MYYKFSNFVSKAKVVSKIELKLVVRIRNLRVIASFIAKIIHKLLFFINSKNRQKCMKDSLDRISVR